jgi:hypothetical protein
MTRAGAPVIFTSDIAAESQDFLRKETADSLYINLNEPYSNSLDMNGNKIINVHNPVDLLDVANKVYVDNNFVNKLLSPNIESNLNMNNNRITNVEAPREDKEAANKKYVDEAISKLRTIIPTMKVYKFEFLGSYEMQTSSRTVIREITDEVFNNTKSENIILLASCQHERTNNVHLTSNARVVNITGNVLTIRIKTNNELDLSWTISYVVFIRLIIVPNISESNNEQANYYLSPDTLRELSN